MNQMWLTFARLGLDFLGFCLLLREWWLAFFHENSELALAKRRAWEQSLRHFSHSHMTEGHRSLAETSARVHDDMAARNAHAAAAATLNRRKRVFVAASVLIVAGFALQIVGALPGCCPPWITPQT